MVSKRLRSREAVIAAVIALTILSGCRATEPLSSSGSVAVETPMPSAPATSPASGSGIGEAEAIAIAVERREDPEAVFQEATAGTVGEIDPSLVNPQISADRQVWMIRFAGHYVGGCSVGQTCGPPVAGYEEIYLDRLTGQELLRHVYSDP